jgi:hypothetical protein
MDIHQFIDTYALPVIISSVISGAVGFYFNFARGFSKEFFDKRARKEKHKLNVAQHVFQICNEADTNSFRVLPKDIEHINSVKKNVKALDEKVGNTMTEFISSWYTFARGRKNESRAEDIRFLDREHKQAETRMMKLLEWANKIRIG